MQRLPMRMRAMLLSAATAVVARNESLACQPVSEWMQLLLFLFLFLLLLLLLMMMMLHSRVHQKISIAARRGPGPAQITVARTARASAGRPPAAA
jgi:hypothetical protein